MQKSEGEAGSPNESKISEQTFSSEATNPFGFPRRRWAVTEFPAGLLPGNQVTAAIQWPRNFQHCIYDSCNPLHSSSVQAVLNNAYEHGLGARRAGLIPGP